MAGMAARVRPDRVEGFLYGLAAVIPQVPQPGGVQIDGFSIQPRASCLA